MTLIAAFWRHETLMKCWWCCDDAAVTCAGFMSHVVEPLFVEWQRFAPCHRSRVMLTHLRNNRVAWQRKQVSALTSSQPRRHSVPTTRDVTASRPRDIAPPVCLTVTQLDALSKCSPSLVQCSGRGQFPFSAKRQTVQSSDHVTRSPPSYLHYLVLLADRRLSLNSYCAHARRTVMTSRKRSRSLVTPCTHLGNGVASGHLAKPDVTSSSSGDALPIARTTGWLRSSVDCSYVRLNSSLRLHANTSRHVASMKSDVSVTSPRGLA